MKKLVLNLDNIQVTGFEVAPQAAGRGTVDGAQIGTVYTACAQRTCHNAYTCLC